MTFIEKERELINQELRKEIGNWFNVNHLPSTYPKPNGQLVAVGNARSKFVASDGRTYTCNNGIASNIIWGR